MYARLSAVHDDVVVHLRQNQMEISLASWSVTLTVMVVHKDQNMFILTKHTSDRHAIKVNYTNMTSYYNLRASTSSNGGILDNNNFKYAAAVRDANPCHDLSLCESA